MHMDLEDLPYTVRDKKANRPLFVCVKRLVKWFKRNFWLHKWSYRNPRDLEEHCGKRSNKMTQKVTIEEAKGMLGAEFTYVYKDGDMIESYVRAFDPEVGMTCYALYPETRDGWVSASAEPNEGGAWCVTAYNFKRDGGSLEEALMYLTKIRNTGVIRPSTDLPVAFGWGSPVCAF